MHQNLIVRIGTWIGVIETVIENVIGIEDTEKMIVAEIMIDEGIVHVFIYIYIYIRKKNLTRL